VQHASYLSRNVLSLIGLSAFGHLYTELLGRATEWVTIVKQEVYLMYEGGLNYITLAMLSYANES
jgi:hypothetical protein